jgi:hypothetical protein
VDYGTFAVPSPTPTISDTVPPPHGPHTIPDTRGLFVLHAVLMHTGKILVFSGHVELSHYATHSYVLTVKASASPAPNHTLKRVPFPAGIDLFCCHYVQIADGKILAVGGSDPDFRGHGSRGARTICTFDPVSETWDRKPDPLVQGRWYPTAVLLGNGRVLVVSGRREYGAPAVPGNIADVMEVIAPPNFKPSLVSGGTFRLPLYPGLHLNPQGKVFYSHTNWGLEIDDVDTRSFLMTSPTAGTWTSYAGNRPIQPRREEGMSVLLPPASAGKVLVVGGTIAETAAPANLPTVRVNAAASYDHVHDLFDSFSTEIMDTMATPPTWTDTTHSMVNGRTNGHLVLLPDKTVLVCGGHDRYKWLSNAGGTTPSTESEAYLPATQVFEERAVMKHPRMYHSVALLLPDGRVLAAGGADPNAVEPTLPYPPAAGADPGWNGPRYTSIPLNRKDFEIFEPPYMHLGARPAIDKVQKSGADVTQVFYGDTFQVLTNQAAAIRDVAFMRPGAPTHHTDTEQRYVELTKTAGTNVLNVTAPTNRNEAPPGYYMLWIVDTTGRPCTMARFIQLAEPPPTPIDDPPLEKECAVATAALGSAAEPGVVYLRRLRVELFEATGGGRRFVLAVNRVYYSFSPALAGWLARHRRARVAARDALVRPAIAAIAAADAVTRPLTPRGARHAALIALLLAEAALTLLALPLLLLVAAVRALADGDDDAD